MNTGSSRAASRRLVGWLFVAVAGMFGFGYALVPLYNVFCDIAGINGKVTRAEAQTLESPATAGKRLVEIQFTGTVMAGLQWEFSPAVRTLKVRPGEPITVSYLATNRSAGPTVGQAVPSVTPGRAARYFNKTECFCFERQPLEAGESKAMPLTFMVDAALPDDVQTITLSYALFSLDEPPAVSRAETRAYSENNG